MSTKVFSFSVKNGADKHQVSRLREHSRKTGISFSFLIVKAITKYLETLNDSK